MRRGLMVCFALAAFALTLGFAVHAADSSKPVSASQPASQAAAPERPLKIAFNPEQYDAVKDYVRPGDLIFAFCVRDPGRDASGQFAPTWAPEKFARRIPLVDGLADTRLERTVVLSSIEDLAAHAGE
ncbi:MAG: hypothetical protein NTW86_20335, partial [Candidatus Sumerlaeota bacterium]|nr:hypothetical protein [Candidatus Sumerlaeota bacterium]